MTEFNPVLHPDTKKTKSFEITNFFYVALFGGTVALIIVGIWNATMLKLRLTTKLFLIMTSLSIYIVRLILVYMNAHALIHLTVQYGFSLYKIADLLLFLLYYHIQKRAYRLHLIFNGQYQYLLYRGRGPFICFCCAILDYILIVALSS